METRIEKVYGAVMKSVWIVDDEPAICLALRKAFEHEGYSVDIFSNAESFTGRLDATTKVPDAVLLDVRLPGRSGLETLHDLQNRTDAPPIILMTAFGDMKVAVESVRGKAFELLTKPFDLETALRAVTRAIEQKHERKYAADRALAARMSDELWLGSAPAVQHVYKEVALAAASVSPVLIEGESGTGKSLVAAMIHRTSQRSSGPLLYFRGAAQSAPECENELFGQQAIATRSSRATAEVSGNSSGVGLLELAEGGSVVIDEVLHIPLATQHKVLAAMESRTFAQISSNVTRRLNARLLFTTEHDLNAAVDDGEFLASLASQLNVHRILLPPLREHPEDIRSLTLAFLAIVAEGRELEITERALKALERYDWPGNMRELRQVMQRACLQARGATVDIDDFAGALAPAGAMDRDDSRSAELAAATRQWLSMQSRREGTADEPGAGYLYDECMRIVETSLIEQLLKELDGNRAAVAARLGLHRTTLRQKMKRYKLD